MKLSERRTLTFIRQFFQQHDYSPTTAEIAAGIGISSRGVVARYLKALEAAGHIKRMPGQHRNILLCQLPSSPNSIPLVGTIAAGVPIEAIAQHEQLHLTELFLGENRFALRVKGDSMIDEGIHDGDVVICEHCTQAEDGRIVVALIDGLEATLKRLQNNRDGTFTLIPANARLTPLTVAADRLQIQGVFVGLLRYS